VFSTYARSGAISVLARSQSASLKAVSNSLATWVMSVAVIDMVASSLDLARPTLRPSRRVSNLRRSCRS
jgi:hypothetical protein